jgi:hypothetical protein
MGDSFDTGLAAANGDSGAERRRSSLLLPTNPFVVLDVVVRLSGGASTSTTAEPRKGNFLGLFSGKG